MDLQDKLHHNICRKRSIASVGTHNLDTIQGPFRYCARPPQDISFVPLFHEKEFRADELIEWYRTDPAGKHIKPYTSLIADSPVYPVIVDANEVVCSLPPLINGAHSKMSWETRNVLLEVTATDLHKAETVLNLMVTLFSQYCDQPFTVEPVGSWHTRTHPPARGQNGGTMGVGWEVWQRRALGEPLMYAPAAVPADGPARCPLTLFPACNVRG